MTTAEVGVGTGSGVGIAAAVARGEVTAALSGVPGVASGAARVGRSVDAVGEVARGVLIASGCPQLVSTNTSNKSLQQRTTSQIFG